MSRRAPVFICGGDMRPGPRSECPNALHDWPLPAGYVDAFDAAMSRLHRRWANPRCPDCGVYGWRPGEIRDETRVPLTIERSDRG